MASKYYTFSGKLKWVKAREPDEMYQNYTVDLYLDDKSWEIFSKSGLQLQPKEDEDGRYVRFRRPATKVIKDELVKFGPPKVAMADGSDVSATIGNGSTGKVNVVVYDTRKGLGHRWERLTVDELIPYERPDDNETATPEEVVAAKEVSKEKPAKKARPF